MRLTSEEFDALKRLIWNCIERHAEAPIYSTDKLNRLQGQEAVARAVLCGAQPPAIEGIDAAGLPVCGPTVAAEPTRPVTDEDVTDADITYWVKRRDGASQAEAMRAALENFAKRRGI